MGLVLTEITISGLLKAEVDDGITNLRDEFASRPWMLNPTTAWEGDLFVVAVAYEGSDLKTCGRAAYDEVWDCIIACLECSTNLHFEIRRSEFVARNPDTQSN